MDAPHVQLPCRQQHLEAAVRLVVHPSFDNLLARDLTADDLMIAPARESDLSALQDIAERAFKYERHQESLIVRHLRRLARSLPA
jgi:hypothetical protein